MKNQIEKIKEGVRSLQKRADGSTEKATKVLSACDAIDASWSGSDLVGHADLFYGNFDTPPLRERFNVEWGLINGIPDGWGERSSDEVRLKIEKDSGVSLDALDKDADRILSQLDELRKKATIEFSAFSKDLAEEIEGFHFETKVDIFNQYWKRQIVTRDSGALYAGRKVPMHKYFWATASFLIGVDKQCKEFLYLIDKLIAQSGGIQQKSQHAERGRTTYVDKYTLLRLTKIVNDNFDLSRLISLCNELDDNYSLENYHSCAMLLRAILDHLPPIFGKRNFDDICSQYGNRSFKDIIRPLNETAKKIGDGYLHTQISKKVLAVTRTQVSFQANLDTLLNEASAILEKQMEGK